MMMMMMMMMKMMMMKMMPLMIMTMMTMMMMWTSIFLWNTGPPMYSFQSLETRRQPSWSYKYKTKIRKSLEFVNQTSWF